MRSGNGYIPVDSDVPYLGLATSTPSTKLHPSYSPRLMNCVVRDGVVRRRAGGYQLGQQLVGKVMVITEAGEIGQEANLVVLTSARQYVFDPDLQLFIDITIGRVEYNVFDYGNNFIRIVGNHTLEFTVGRKFPVEQSDDNDGVYTVVTSTFGGGLTTINVSETLPNNTLVPVSDVVTIATDLSTTDTDFIDSALLTDLDGRRFLMTNGRDGPRVWDCDASHPFTFWAPTYPNFVTCRTLAVFNEHLFLGGITTVAEFDPQLISWSNAGHFDNFTGGDSGDQLLYQLTDGMIHMRVLGDRLVIYSFDTIMTGVFIGAPAVFQFEVVIPEGVRFCGPKAACSINVGHVYISEENFYIFDGSRGLRVLGNPIYNDLKTTKDHSQLILVAVLNDPSKRTIYFSVPTVTGFNVTYTMFYDLSDLSNVQWAKEQYSKEVTAWGFYVNRGDVLTWEDASYEPVDNPWENEIGSWLEETEQLNFPIRTYGTEDGYVVIANESALEDMGEAVEQLYETKDFEVPKEIESTLGRWGELEFEGSGSTVDVFYSVDKGRTFLPIEEIALDAVITTYRSEFDAVGRTIRFRFVSNGFFQLSWIRAWVKDAGPQ